MKIAFDARCIRCGMTGVGYYASFLAEALPVVRPDDAFVFLALRRQDPIIFPRSALLGHHTEWVGIDHDYEDHPRGDWWEHVRLPGLLDSLDVDVFHGPAFLIPFGPRRPRAALVTTIHDLSVFSEPQAYPSRFRHYLRFVIRRAVLRAHRVVCPSEFVKSDILRRVEGARAERIAVVPHAPHAAFSTQSDEAPEAARHRLHLPGRFLLMIGTFRGAQEPGVSARTLRGSGEAPRAAAADRLGGPERLWRRGAARETHAAAHARALRLARQGRVRRSADRVPSGPRHDLPVAQRRLRLAPARSDGHGAPVVSSDETSLPETVGPGGICLPLGWPQRWASVLATLIESREAHEDASRRARDFARRFTCRTWRRRRCGSTRTPSAKRTARRPVPRADSSPPRGR